LLEVEKPGYRKISEELYLDQERLKKEIILEQLGRDVAISSNPSGAVVFLDEEDTGNVTECVLENVPLGLHKIKVAKENHVEWESEVVVEAGDEPLPLEVVLAVNTYVPIKIWGGPSSRMFKTPLAIAIDASNVAFILDESNVKVKRVNAEGRALAWRPTGKGFPGFKAPTDIAIDSEGNVYVTDAKRHAVYKFNNRGQFIQGWGKEGSGQRQFRNPKGISINSQNDIFVVDSGNSRVKRFSKEGAFKQVIGKQGAGDGGFISPVALALNQSGELFVLDRTRVQKFSPEGEFITSIRLVELGKTGVKIPQAIAIDKMGYIYLTDSGYHAVVKLSPDGSLVTQWGGFGTRDGRLSYPAALTLNNNGEVLVVERDNNRIQIFGAPRE
jgi:sugar lactone lactonase YvrE